MDHRLVLVSQSYVNTITFSGIFNIGDSVHFNPISRSLAIQREGNVWNDQYDYHFSDYPIFKRKAKWIERPVTVRTESISHQDTISVGCVSILGVTQSAAVQFGGLDYINSDSRIKHIRIIKEEDKK